MTEPTTAVELACSTVKPKPTKSDIYYAMAVALWEKRKADRDQAEKERLELSREISKRLRSVVAKLLRDNESKVSVSFTIWDSDKRNLRVSFDDHPMVEFDALPTGLVDRYIKARNRTSGGSYSREQWIREKVKELRSINETTVEDRALMLLSNPAIKAALLEEAEALDGKPTQQDKAKAITV